MKLYSMHILLALLIVTVALPRSPEIKGSEGQPQTKEGSQATQSKGNGASKLLGTWKIISLEAHDSTGRVSYPFGREPKGYIAYDSTGHMGVHIMNPERPRPDPGSNIARGYLAYFGAYEVDEKAGVVIHHMEGNTNPNLTGTDYIRYYDFDGDILTLTATQLVDGKYAPKSPNAIRVTWRRVR